MTATERTVTLLPDPEPRPIRYPLISVDDHVIEPRDMFEGRMPRHLVERAPRIIEAEDGTQVWVYEDNIYGNIGLNAVVGRPADEWRMDPARFDEMRKGCWDIDARIADMDLVGVHASLNFPSLIAGFAGSVFAQSKDPELGLACMRAWNEWLLDVWAAPYPDRIIPLQLTWLADPQVAAQEIRANAERGFKAVSMIEAPTLLDLPSLHVGYWDPIVGACEETDTVLCLHTGSAGRMFGASEGVPLEALVSLFPSCGLLTTADWLWSGLPVRYPNVKIAISEGGIGWVPLYLDRLEYMMLHSSRGVTDWPDREHSPADVLRRNFWFCTIDDPSTMPLLDRIGVDRVMFEVDYPHADSSWPDTQDVAARLFDGLPAETVRKITYENAAALFRHPLPPERQPA